MIYSTTETIPGQEIDIHFVKLTVCGHYSVSAPPSSKEGDTDLPERWYPIAVRAL